MTNCDVTNCDGSRLVASAVDFISPSLSIYVPLDHVQMPRPVLVDLPLEPFLRAASDDANLPIPRTGSKRSRSPSLARSIFSPAKRRILEQEALFSPSQSRSYRAASDNSLHPHRNALLHAFASSTCLLGPSPAGPSDTHPAPPCHPHALVPPSPRESKRISPRLSTSPRSKSRHSPTTTPIRVSPRKTRSQTTTTPPSSQRQSARHASTRSPKTPTTTLTMIPREMPPPPDRRSVHYPGFDVRLDTHIALPCTRSKARAKAEADAVATRVQEGEAAKENVRPSPMAASTSSSTSKAKGDIVPRRSARLRTNNNGCVPSSQKVAPQARDHGRLWSTLHDSYLQL